MNQRISVSARFSSERKLRCALCHDTSGRLERCERCATTFHWNCRVGTPRCPTLGCVASVPRSGRSVAAVYLGGRGDLDGRERPSFGAALAHSFVTGGLAVIAICFMAACDGESGYVPGLARASAVILTLVHYFYAPARWAVVRRGDREPLPAGFRAMLGVIGCLALALLCAVLAASAVPILGVVAVLLVLFAPPLGAHFGAGEGSVR